MLAACARNVGFALTHSKKCSSSPKRVSTEFMKVCPSTHDI
jgi:hypothetical protein